VSQCNIDDEYNYLLQFQFLRSFFFFSYPPSLFFFTGSPLTAAAAAATTLYFYNRRAEIVREKNIDEKEKK